jgi:arginase
MEIYKLIKNRSDIGAGTRVLLGIDAIEIAAINQNSDYFNQFEFEDVKTTCESIYDKNRSSSAKESGKQCAQVCNAVKKI